ncbi:uncharacterized protein MONOS_5850 [Monocercomonoides exilis]|uniref:uncharacterized protein n=1 Tax=Monocercomonoides exilis TaxID=2049356 RepID=UPI00355ACA31|nr:hypothetical protein MONOS_5850 [Monocercomonoides exilis]|eukprot:MONOS_5850.1-p1 / transcript=MONOS_5850.1 / gene=MONOS_5850 / organism=Monocercomonoides_exilis_PA203 / gene_product=unspecified product / transcript_product=unspecified product / location=Mono_scaffold00176:18158-19629(+) / protein_length=443 / sequence_SO=supercontig / SO=protein_coding / is_pseudo=false
MKESSDKKHLSEFREISFLELLSKLYTEPGKCAENEQKQKIKEMNELIGEMDEEEFDSVFTIELFNKMDKMIEEKELLLEDAILLLKEMGCNKVIKKLWSVSFNCSSLCKRLMKMIVDENRKKEEKNENLLLYLCECYLLLHNDSEKLPQKLLSICLSSLLKAALKKEKRKETQSDVEIVFAALSNIGQWVRIEKELYMNEMIEIIKHHQEHHNLTHIAYLSAWVFLMDRSFGERGLEEVIANELHIARETARELEELAKCVDWENEEETKRKKEAFLIKKWISLVTSQFPLLISQKEDNVELLHCLVQLCRASRGNGRKIYRNCANIFQIVAEVKKVSVEVLIKGRAIDVMLEEMQQSTLDVDVASGCLRFFFEVSKKLDGNDDIEIYEDKRKDIKMEIFEKIEEEGFEDEVTNIFGIFFIFNGEYYAEMSLDLTDYLVNK